ncbi:hypothetical protein NL676_016593 [Syzygium grande]|nr:hypothetical protein NL676_016593 [Syzygium grande]
MTIPTHVSPSYVVACPHRALPYINLTFKCVEVPGGLKAPAYPPGLEFSAVGDPSQTARLPATARPLAGGDPPRAPAQSTPESLSLSRASPVTPPLVHELRRRRSCPHQAGHELRPETRRGPLRERGLHWKSSGKRRVETRWMSNKVGGLAPAARARQLRDEVEGGLQEAVRLRPPRLEGDRLPLFVARPSSHQEASQAHLARAISRVKGGIQALHCKLGTRYWS